MKKKRLEKDTRDEIWRLEGHIAMPEGKEDVYSLVKLARLCTERAIQHYWTSYKILVGKGYYTRAIACCLEILSIDQKNREALRNLVVLYRKSGLLPQSIECKQRLNSLGKKSRKKSVREPI
jgi:tetratricopeptide (TPR) repeat protein